MEKTGVLRNLGCKDRGHNSGRIMPMFYIALLWMAAIACDQPDIKAKCDAHNGGLTLPDGFCAYVVADNLGRARHLTVNDNGDIYVALRRPHEGGTIVALRDTEGDGRADQIARFGEIPGTGIDIYDGYLYFAPDTLVLRYALTGGQLIPGSAPDTVISGLLSQRQHRAKPFTFDDRGWMYVDVGAPSNACQEEIRTPGSPGMDPCPQLEAHAGIWRFSADKLNQTQLNDGYRFASGIRHAVALDWNPVSQKLYVVQHGRDQLDYLWPKLFTAEQNAELPAEEFLMLSDGANFGWPYCYYDPKQGKKVLAPEYGGDGRMVGRCAEFEDPIMAFPGHWAPNDLLFYTGTQFPERYRNGAFVAFHGSWNRAPMPQRGYNVVFVPFEGDQPSGDWQVFADGFAGLESISTPRDAKFRPMGLAQGPDGSLYISDSKEGRIWCIVYVGEVL